mgnify:CR=1 FL=1
MMLTKNNMADKKITILGMKKSGYSAALLASKIGATVFISDNKKDEIVNHNYEKLKKAGLQCEIAGHTDEIYGSDLWILSPGIPKDANIVKKAIKLKIPIISEIEFASRFTKHPIIAVTGSNGKSTTVNMVNDMLNTNDWKPILAGNIGNPFSKSVLDLLNGDIEGNVFILEISSFQLEFIEQFHPFISIYLNISPDHLDRHKNMDEYLKMKLNMVNNVDENDFIIYNSDDKILNTSFNESIAKKIPYSLNKKNKFFSLNSTKIYDENYNTLISLDDIFLKGKHNLSNFIASAIAAKLLNVKNNKIKKTMEQFTGIKHRLQFVKSIKGTAYFNDSKATNISSVIAAINSFNSPIILLLGGKNKDSDFRLLLPHTKRHVKHIVSFGEAGGEIATAIGDAVRLNIMSSLNQAVASAHKIASPGDIILMSPGCASFDEFNNFEDRGEKFIAMVNELN